MRKQFGKDKIIILLGAGASCDAGIKNSYQMITEIESSLKGSWKDYSELYNYIHSSHYHLERIKGTDSKNIYFNIESLVGLLDAIIRISTKEVDIYPFIGSWEKELLTVAGLKLEKAQEFKRLILEKMKNSWLSPEQFIADSSYYKKIKELGYNYPLKIFSLNYDMSVEKNLESSEILLERGFNEQRIWDYRLYEPSEEKEINYFLYKLHGSLDWKRDSENRLTYTDNISNVEPLKMEIIFGVQNKLQSYDPYLFYFYSFREACIDAELIIVSGYGFLDKHINDNITSSIKLDANKKLLVNVFEKDLEKFKNDIVTKLGIQEANLYLENKSAKEFFNDNFNLDYFSTLYKDEESEDSLLP
ncbi:SIR2 family protein [Flavobacterium sp.]|uniref:SIR2 family protein n=1 Tax=Flavobacterium sp. TaxID=239 RepID=UPI0025BAEFD7|nr:SIR2 family protein [Flavobacterium sp.]